MCKIRVHEDLVKAKENLREMREMGLISVPTSRGPITTIPTSPPRPTASAPATKSGTKDENPVGSWLTPEEWQFLKNLRWDDRLLFLLSIIICITLFVIVLIDELLC